MPSVVHVVVTRNAAGVERYVCAAAGGLVERGWEVSVIGGDPDLMPGLLADGVRWLPGGTPLEALRSLRRVGRQDVCHAHMTAAEAVATLGIPLHRAPIVSTRHFAARRGSSFLGRALAPLIAAGLSRELAISEFVASRLGRKPDAVLLNGVPTTPDRWDPSSRGVLVLQRLDAEKDTLTALRAWEASRLWEEGWSLRVAGEGRQRPALERWVAARRLPGVAFVGWVADVSRELASAGMLLASAPAEPFGLSVVEAMAAGVPVVAAAGGGHLETVGPLDGARLFPPGDFEAAAAAMRGLVPDRDRAAVSAAGRELATSRFSLEAHVDQLVGEYAAVRRARSAPHSLPASSPDGTADGLRELVVCSLEEWDEVWRRNQFFVDGLLRRNPGLRVLFVEPPADPIHDLAMRRKPEMPRVRRIDGEGRLWAFRPLKPLPRRLGFRSIDASLRAQVTLSARMLGFRNPTLWLNDVTYAPLIRSTGWPSLYDVTDDWLAAPLSARERRRFEQLEQLALEDAASVVVCSPGLAHSRGQRRPVVLVPNAVDVAHFQHPRERPSDLPRSPVAVYVGSLHESRLDIELVVEVARAQPELTLVLVGPNSLKRETRERLAFERNVVVLGVRPYHDVPAYIQHADLVIVPHLVNEFTESLDPIKAYECLASSTPTVATPVAGFRELAGGVALADRESFTWAVESVLAGNLVRTPTAEPPSWEDRAAQFEGALLSSGVKL
jgi:glycosyltransferase involved in cell wall biosynthesis